MSKYDYEFDWDNKYCYPNSYILKNKLNITDPKLLMEAERKIVAVKLFAAKESPIQGNFDLSHFLGIHKFLFEDIYSWAGEIREVNISKGSSFCLAIHVRTSLESIFADLKQEQYLLQRLAHYLGELNAVHPFREGNGRVQRLFIEYLAEKNGYHLDFSMVSSEEMIAASETSIKVDDAHLQKILEKIIN
jgi:cell filamentation protein